MKPLFHLRRSAMVRRLSNIPLTVPVRSKQTGYVVYLDLFRNFAFAMRRQYEIENPDHLACSWTVFIPGFFGTLGQTSVCIHCFSFHAGPMDQFSPSNPI